MNHRHRQRRNAIVPGLILASALLTSPSTVLALNPPQQIGQYAHTSWTVGTDTRRARSLRWLRHPTAICGWPGNPGCFVSMVLNSRSGSHRWARVCPTGPTACWYPATEPCGSAPSRARELEWSRSDPLSGARDGFVTSLLEDRDGTVWAGYSRTKAGVRNSRRTGAVSPAGGRIRHLCLESGGGPLGCPVGWRGNRALAMETRTAQTIRDAREAWRLDHDRPMESS